MCLALPLACALVHMAACSNTTPFGLPVELQMKKNRQRTSQLDQLFEAALPAGKNDPGRIAWADLCSDWTLWLRELCKAVFINNHDVV